MIIVNWNLKDILRECLESVEENASDLSVETIVVDNASDDGSVGMVNSHFPRALLIRNTENIGFSRANNQAMRRASGRYFFLLNSDAVLSRGSLRKLVAFMDANSEVGIAGPGIVNDDGTPQIRSRGRFPSIGRMMAHFFLPGSWSRRGHDALGIYDEDNGNGPRAVDWVSGCALMARREAVETVGMLDANVFMYCEDVDWCYRMRLGGWKVFFVPDTKVMHYGGLSMKQQKGRVVAAHARGLAAFYGKYHGRVASAVFNLVLWLGYGVRTVGWTLEALRGRSSGMDKIRRMLSRGKQGSNS